MTLLWPEFLAGSDAVKLTPWGLARGPFLLYLSYQLWGNRTSLTRNSYGNLGYKWLCLQLSQVTQEGGEEVAFTLRHKFFSAGEPGHVGAPFHSSWCPWARVVSDGSRHPLISTQTQMCSCSVIRYTHAVGAAPIPADPQISALSLSFTTVLPSLFPTEGLSLHCRMAVCCFCTPLAGPMHYTVMGAQHKAQAYMDQWGASLLPSSVFPMGCDQVSQIPAHPLVGTLAWCILQSKTLLHTLVVWLGCPAPLLLATDCSWSRDAMSSSFFYFPLCPCCSHLQSLAHAFPRQNHTGTGKMSFLQSSPSSLQLQSIVEVVSSLVQLVQWLKADLEANLCFF